MNHAGAVAGKVVAHLQQPPGLDLQAGLLPHLPHQGSGQGPAVLDLTAGQAPRPPRIRVLVQQQDATVLDDDAGHAHMHSVTQPSGQPPSLSVPKRSRTQKKAVFGTCAQVRRSS